LKRERISYISEGCRNARDHRVAREGAVPITYIAIQLRGVKGWSDTTWGKKKADEGSLNTKKNY